jgi:hypothetical protein
MNHRQKVIKELKEYFIIQELVGRRTYKKYGERAFKFFRTEALESLLITRKGLGRSITINNWHRGGRFSQRGLRTNVQNMFKQYFSKGRLYLSGHVLACAFDFDVKGMTPNQVRKWIQDNAHRYPCKIRLERKLRGKFINWTHLDTIQEPQNPKIYLFDV